MTNIIFFKSQAKFLQKDFNNQQTLAIARYKRIFYNKEKPTLMNFQHIIARESAFINWNELIHADENKLDVAKVLYINYGLNPNGIQFGFNEVKGTIVDRFNYIFEMRRKLLNDSNFIITLSLFLKEHIIPTNTIRKEFDSYEIKHIVEKKLTYFGIDENYIENGQLIIAAIIAGFKFQLCNNDRWNPNVYFNMQKKSIEKLSEYNS